MPSFYATQIALAQQHGARPLQEPDEEEWEDEPSEGEEGDLMGLPGWIYYLLTLDDLYDPGLHDITGRRMHRGRQRRDDPRAGAR